MKCPEGPFTPVTEEVTAFDLPVTGRIPAELNGRYLEPVARVHLPARVPLGLHGNWLPDR
jgi:carotenoid cleavage dioxygenase-like enzyme